MAAEGTQSGDTWGGPQECRSSPAAHPGPAPLPQSLGRLRRRSDVRGGTTQTAPRAPPCAPLATPHVGVHRPPPRTPPMARVLRPRAEGRASEVRTGCPGARTRTYGEAAESAARRGPLVQLGRAVGRGGVQEGLGGRRRARRRLPQQARVQLARLVHLLLRAEGPALGATARLGGRRGLAGAQTPLPAPRLTPACPPVSGAPAGLAAAGSRKARSSESAPSAAAPTAAGDAERGSAPAAVAGASPAVCGWPRRAPASRPPAGPSHLSRVNSRFTGTLPRQPSPAGRRWSLPTAREPARGRGEHADPQRTLCSPAAGRSGTAGSVGTAGSAWPPAGGRGAG